MRPNVLIINPDQMRADALGHLGNAAAYTPALDQLARAGFVSGENVVFSQYTKDAMFLYYTMFPAVGTLLSAIPYFFYKIEGPLLDKVQADLAQRRAAVKELQHDT